MFEPKRLLALALVASPLAGQDRITVLEATAAGGATIRSWDEANPAGAPTTVLTDVVIRPVEITNRTQQDAFDPDRPRLGVRLGVPTLELPGGGRILRYSRLGGARWGFVLVSSSGVASVLHEIAGVGAGGLEDPYEPRIGIAPDGRHASFATVAGALHLARLDGGVWPSSGAPTRPIPLPAGVAVEPFSMTPGTASLFYVTDDDRVRRCALVDGALPQDVTPAGGPRLKDELALSGDGSKLVFLYGPRDLYTIYLVGDAGPAQALPPPPAKYEEPGYLPDVVGGPELMLDETGGKLLYTDATIRDEIYLLDIATGATTHVTSDPNFMPYIGVGILPAFTAGELVLAVGDPIGFDWFAATTSSDVVRNLTRTGPVPRPYDVGSLVPLAGYRAPSGAVLSFEAAGPSLARARRIDPASATDVVVAGALDDVPRLGGTFSSTAFVRLGGTQGDMLLDAATAAPRIPGPPGVVLSNEIVGPGGGYGMFVASLENDPTGAVVPILDVFGAGLIALPAEVGLLQFVLTRAGGALLNGTTLRHLGNGRVTPITGGPGTRIVLSGVSG